MSNEDFESDERIVRLRFLHSAGEAYDAAICEECSDPENSGYVMWPCQTIRTVNGEKFWMNTPDELSELA